jgi:hypothetical protein
MSLHQVTASRFDSSPAFIEQVISDALPNTSPHPARVELLRSPSSLNNLDHHDDDGDDQQDMNEPTTRIATDKSQQPQNEENHTYGPKHVRLLSNDRIRLSV